MALSLKSPPPAVNWHCVFSEPGLSSDEFSISDYPIIWQVFVTKLGGTDQDKLRFLAKNRLILKVFLSIFPEILLGLSLIHI